jgi:sRNA-binding carbon storage regulator CsrA
MVKKIEAEQQKSQCLMKAIKEKELENQYNIKEKETEEEVANIKVAASQQVLIRRSELKEQIQKMRKKAARRKAELSKQLLSVRTVMAETMGKVYKKGDQAKCQKAIENPNERNTYCSANFYDDYSKMKECKETDEFCTLCCDTEFGELHINERKNCYKSICPADIKKGAAGNAAADGRWIWQAAVLN